MRFNWIKKFSFLGNLLIYFNYIAVGCLLLSYIAPYTSPEAFWPIAFFGLAYPFLLLVNLLFAMLWILKKRKLFWVSLISIIIGYEFIGNTFQINFSKDKNGEKGIGVLSYNVRIFDLYNWRNNKDSRDKIFDLLDREAPDILCLQEFFYSEKKRYFNTLDTLAQFLKAGNHHAEYTKTLWDTDHWGIVTFSTYPIINKGRLNFQTGSNNICIYTDIKVNSDTFRVYNMHLASIHFGDKDYKTVDNINKSGTLEILKKLKRAFQKRAVQADLIAKHLEKSPYPIILCGDFNDSPISYAYQKISKGLLDAFVESGNGLGGIQAGK